MWISTWKQASLYYANRIPFIELSAFPFSVPSNPTQPNPTQLANLVKNKTTQSSNGKSVQSAAGSIARSLVLESDDDNWVDFGFCANFVQVHVEIYPAVVPVCKNLLGKTARLDFAANPRQRHQKSVHQAQQQFSSKRWKFILEVDNDTTKMQKQYNHVVQFSHWNWNISYRSWKCEWKTWIVLRNRQPWVSFGLVVDCRR